MKRAAIAIAIGIAIAVGVFVIGIVWQEVYFPGACQCEPLDLHVRWHVREVITAFIALAAGALYVAVSGLILQLRHRQTR